MRISTNITLKICFLLVIVFNYKIYFCLNDYRTHMGEDTLSSYPQRIAGVCDIRLNPKASYDTLKKYSSPVIIKSIIMNGDKIRITLSGNTGLPSYTVSKYKLTSGNETIQIPDIKPGEEKTINLQTNFDEFTIFRPTGFEVLSRKFR